MLHISTLSKTSLKVGLDL